MGWRLVNDAQPPYVISMHIPHEPDSLLFGNRYRIPSTRLRGWNYSNPGSYFVTICTKERVHWFGKIQNQGMDLSNIGKIVDDEWNKTSYIRPNVLLDRYVIMPNHFHGIITLQDHEIKMTYDGGMPVGGETPSHGVSTETEYALKWRPGSLGAIIHQFKRASTKRIRAIGNVDFTWQPRYHDRVIRTESELIRIRQYIANNPTKWEQDNLFY